jgi:hypothetical protein
MSINCLGFQELQQETGRRRSKPGPAHKFRQRRAALTLSCFSGFDPSLMAQGSQAIRESSSVLGEGNSLGR